MLAVTFNPNLPQTEYDDSGLSWLHDTRPFVRLHLHSSHFARTRESSPRRSHCGAAQSWRRERQPNLAALNRGRHLYSAGRPSRWELTHISSSSHLALTCESSPRRSHCGAAQSWRRERGLYVQLSGVGRQLRETDRSRRRGRAVSTAAHGGQLGAEVLSGDAVQDEVDAVVEAGQLVVDGARDDVRRPMRPVGTADRQRDARRHADEERQRRGDAQQRRLRERAGHHAADRSTANLVAGLTRLARR